MHVVAVLEYPTDDSASLCFIDLDQLDPKNEVHSLYLEAIRKARKDEQHMGDIANCNNMVMYGNKEMKKAVVRPTRRKPLEVKEAFTIWQQE